MQKKILTAAVAAALVAPAAVMAQSTVVLYGLVDVGYQNVSKYKTPGTADGDKSGFGNSGARSSRLGARATEDLGGGLSARAVIEFDIQGDTGGTAGGALPGAGVTGRQTFVALDSKSWGELSLGRQLTHSFGNVAMAEGIAGAVSFQSFYTLEDQVTRASNYLKYSSPLIGGGFTFGAGWSPGEATGATTVQDTALVARTTGGSVAQAAKGNARYWDMHVRWEQGPFGIGLAQARTKLKTSPGLLALASACTGGTAGLFACTAPTAAGIAGAALGQDATEKDTSLAAYYKFSGWRIYGVTTQSKQTGTGAAENRRLNGGRVEADIGKGILAVSVAKSKNKLVTSADSNFFALGYYHQMTTRTQFYATYGRVKNQTGGSMGLNGQWSAFTPAASAATGGGGQVAADADPRGFQLGMGHSF